MGKRLKNTPSLEEYQKWLKDNGIRNMTEFEKFDREKIPENYPRSPNNFYKKYGYIKN